MENFENHSFKALTSEILNIRSYYFFERIAWLNTSLTYEINRSVASGINNVEMSICELFWISSISVVIIERRFIEIFFSSDRVWSGFIVVSDFLN